MVGPIYSMGPKLPHPPGGRCMPNRCYCTCCPSYVPIPAPAPLDEQDQKQMKTTTTAPKRRQAKR